MAHAIDHTLRRLLLSRPVQGVGTFGEHVEDELAHIIERVLALGRRKESGEAVRRLCDGRDECTAARDPEVAPDPNLLLTLT